MAASALRLAPNLPRSPPFVTSDLLFSARYKHARGARGSVRKLTRGVRGAMIMRSAEWALAFAPGQHCIRLSPRLPRTAICKPARSLYVLANNRLRGLGTLPQYA